MSAPQFSETKTLPRRGLFSCTAWAISSLPVPLSPLMRTGALELEILSSTWKISIIRGLDPIIKE